MRGKITEERIDRLDIGLSFSLICLTVLVSLVFLKCLIIRLYPSSWASPSGLILLGGVDSRATEKIQEDGTSTASYSLKYSTA